MRQLTIVALFLAINMVALGAAHAWDRKGRLKQDSRHPAVLTPGKPQALPKGLELTIRLREPGNGQGEGRLHLWLERTQPTDPTPVETGYVAYPQQLIDTVAATEEKGAKPRESIPIQMSEKPSTDCQWKYNTRNGQTRYLSLLEMERYTVPDGPYSGWELRIKDGQLLIAKPGTEAYAKSEGVGAYREYDNLDDGK